MSIFGSVALALSISAMPQDSVGQPVRDGETILRLPSGREVRFAHKFSQRATLWDDTALIWPWGSQLYVLDGGSAARRVAYESGDKYELGGMLSMSDDGSTLFAWLSMADQLVRMDTETGLRKKLFETPTRAVSWCARGYDPSPIERIGGVAQHGPNVLLMTQSSGNDEASRLDEREDRGRGHRLLAVAKDGGGVVDLTGSRTLSGDLISWDVVRSTGELFLLVVAQRRHAPELRVIHGDGTPTGRFGCELQGGRELLVSPDERWLIIECREWIAGERPSAIPASNPELVRLQDATSLVPKGLVLVDVANDQFVDVIGKGYGASWSPDGKRVAWLDDWEMWLYDVETRTKERIFGREAASVDPPAHWARPVWSRDGHRLVCMPGGVEQRNDRERDMAAVLVDFARREVVLVPYAIEGAVWCPVAHPFAKAH